MKHQKKQIAIESIQFTGDNMDKICKDLGENHPISPKGLKFFFNEKYKVPVEIKPGDTIVKYPDGYFDLLKNTRYLAKKLTFGQAIDSIIEKNYKYMRLPRWSDDVKIMVQFPDKHSKMTAPYFYVESRFGSVPWIPTMIEMFSKDWEVFN